MFVAQLKDYMVNVSRDSPSRYKELAPEVRRMRNALEDFEELLCIGRARSIDHLAVLDVLVPCKSILQCLDRTLQAYRCSDVTTSSIDELRSRLCLTVEDLGKFSEGVSRTKSSSDGSIDLKTTIVLSPQHAPPLVELESSFSPVLSSPASPRTEPQVQSVEIAQTAHHHVIESDSATTLADLAKQPATEPLNGSSPLDSEIAQQDLAHHSSNYQHRINEAQTSSNTSSPDSQFDWHSPFASLDPLSVDIASASSFILGSPASTESCDDPFLEQPISPRFAINKSQERAPYRALSARRASSYTSPRINTFRPPRTRHSSGAPLHSVVEESDDEKQERSAPIRRDSHMNICDGETALESNASQEPAGTNYLVPETAAEHNDLNHVTTRDRISQFTRKEDDTMSMVSQKQQQTTIVQRASGMGAPHRHNRSHSFNISSLGQVKLDGLRLNPPSKALRPTSLPMPPAAGIVNAALPTTSSFSSRAKRQNLPLLTRVNTFVQHQLSPMRVKSAPAVTILPNTTKLQMPQESRPAISISATTQLGNDEPLTPVRVNTISNERSSESPQEEVIESPQSSTTRRRYRIMNPSPPSITDSDEAEDDEQYSTPMDETIISQPEAKIPIITIDCDSSIQQSPAVSQLSTSECVQRRDSESDVSAIDTEAQPATAAGYSSNGHSRETSSSSVSHGFAQGNPEGFINIGFRKSVMDLSQQERDEIWANEAVSPLTVEATSPNDPATQFGPVRAVRASYTLADTYIKSPRLMNSPTAHSSIDAVRIDRICRCWREQSWNQVDAYLISQLESYSLQNSSHAARRARHLLGVSASFQGQWQRALRHFISVLDTPIRALQDLDGGAFSALYWAGDLYCMLNRRTEASLAYSLALQVCATTPVPIEIQTVLRTERDAVMLGMHRERITSQWNNIVEQDYSNVEDSLLNENIVSRQLAHACLYRKSYPATHIMLESTYRSRVSRLKELDPTFMEDTLRTSFKLSANSFASKTAWPMPFDPFFSIGNVVQGRLCEQKCDLTTALSGQGIAKLQRYSCIGSPRFDCFTCSDLPWLISEVRRCLKMLDMRWNEVINSEGAWFMARFAVRQSNIITANYFTIAVFKTGPRTSFGVEVCVDGVCSGRVIRQGPDYINGAHHTYDQRLKKLFKDYLSLAYKELSKKKRMDGGIEEIAEFPSALLDQASIFLARAPRPPPRS